METEIGELLALNWSGYHKPECTLNEGYIAPPTLGEMIEIPERDFWVIIHRLELKDIHSIIRESGQLVFYSDRGFDSVGTFQEGHIMANMSYYRKNKNTILVREDFYKRSSECLGYAQIQKLFYAEEKGIREKNIDFPCSGN